VLAGPGSGLSEEPALGCESVALESVVVPWCPSGPVTACASAVRTAALHPGHQRALAVTAVSTNRCASASLPQVHRSEPPLVPPRRSSTSQERPLPLRYRSRPPLLAIRPPVARQQRRNISSGHKPSSTVSSIGPGCLVPRGCRPFMPLPDRRGSPYITAKSLEVVPGLVEIEVAVPHLRPALR
jgi:hypothetical protein